MPVTRTRLMLTALLLLSTTPAIAADRIGYIRHDANHVEEVRETEENGRKVYIVTAMPSGMTYRVNEPPAGTVWR